MVAKIQVKSAQGLGVNVSSATINNLIYITIVICYNYSTNISIVFGIYLTAMPH